jgi:serine/threonine protein kinase
MIFPSAECDVDIYWEKENPEPDLTDVDFVRWVIKQCRAIMEAVDVIHNPKYPAALPKETLRYGRHGDIKPENILWYKSPDEKDRGIWVISDLGLSAFNREESRSMIPNESILYTPGYRPPECDIEGGTISRAFDIWTLVSFTSEKYSPLCVLARAHCSRRKDVSFLMRHATLLFKLYEIGMLIPKS